MSNNEDYEWLAGLASMNNGLNNIEKKVADSNNMIELLILFLSVANKPDTPDKLTEHFNNMIDGFLEIKKISLEDIWVKQFPEHY